MGRETQRASTILRNKNGTEVAINDQGQLSVDANITVTNAGVERTPTGPTRRTDATGSPIAAGARRITFFNAGGAAVDVNGGTNNLAPGESVSLIAGGEDDTLPAVAYDGTGSTLVVTIIV